jgi:hypothetical protein
MWIVVMCCKILLMGYISSKLEMQVVNLIFLQMGAVDYSVESCGFKYKHVSNSQCYKVKSNIDFFLVYKWVIILDWIVIIRITLNYYFVVRVSYYTACY